MTDPRRNAQPMRNSTRLRQRADPLLTGNMFASGLLMIEHEKGELRIGSVCPTSGPHRAYGGRTDERG